MDEPLEKLVVPGQIGDAGPKHSGDKSKHGWVRIDTSEWMRIATLATQSDDPILAIAYACSRAFSSSARDNRNALASGLATAMQLSSNDAMRAATAVLQALHQPASSGRKAAGSSACFMVPRSVLACSGRGASPLAGLAPRHDVRLVRLALDLYRQNLLRTDGVVAPSALSMTYPRISVDAVGSSRIWTFEPTGRFHVQAVGPLLVQAGGTFFDDRAGDGAWRALAGRIDALVTAGLVAWQGFVVSDFELGDASLTPFATDDAQPRGGKLRGLARSRVRSLLGPSANLEGGIRIPVSAECDAIELRDLLVLLAPERELVAEEPLPSWFAV